MKNENRIWKIISKFQKSLNNQKMVIERFFMRFAWLFLVFAFNRTCIRGIMKKIETK